MDKTLAIQRAHELFVAPAGESHELPHPLVLASIFNGIKRAAGKPGSTYHQYSLAQYQLGEIDMAVEYAVARTSFAGERCLGRVCLVLADSWGVQKREYQLRPVGAGTELVCIQMRIDTEDLDTPTAAAGQGFTAVPELATRLEATRLEGLLLHPLVPVQHIVR